MNLEEILRQARLRQLQQGMQGMPYEHVEYTDPRLLYPNFGNNPNELYSPAWGVHNPLAQNGPRGRITPRGSFTRARALPSASRKGWIDAGYGKSTPRRR